MAIRIFCLAPILALWLAHAANAQTGTPLLEFQLAAGQPCAGLEPVDLLDRLRIDEVNYRAAGFEFSAEVSGSIRCRGGGPLFSLTAFTARAELDLGQCRLRDAAVTLTNLASARVVEARFRARMQEYFTDQIGTWAISACENLTGGTN